MIDFTKYIEVVFTGWETSFNAQKKDGKNKFVEIRNSIESQQVDAIINPTDNELTCFTGENSGIYNLAGEQFIQNCKKIIPVKENAIITSGFDLPAKKIIHLIGPKPKEENKIEKFEKSFIRCLELAVNNNLKTIAFPTIGFSIYEIYHYQVAQIVVSTLKKFIPQNDKIIKFICVSNSDHFYNLYKMLVILPESTLPLFIEFTSERVEKLSKIQNNLAKAIQKIDDAKKKIEQTNKILNQQKEEITLQNELLQQQKEEIVTQNEQLQQKNDEIQLQKDELTRQKQNITDSIEYASLIQKAILPSIDIIEQNFVDNFILYRPCHIVSGDFYWFKQIKNSIYIVVADCTGHGVPGAFMSMLGISLLNELGGKIHLHSPDLILNELRNRIKKSLHQTGKSGEQQDGMDISFCMFDLETKKMQFAGAYNPIYLVRNNQLTEFKADRMPIGVHMRDNKDFTKTEIELQFDDRVFLFSDGFISQLGGDIEETYKAKRFKELLLKINNMPMKNQCQILNQTIDDWRDNLSQTDDILVIGIHIN